MMSSSRRIENLGARYSYVSTPVPARPSTPVEHRDASFRPTVPLDVEVHKPWRRQLFSLGVAQCCVVAVTSVGEGRRGKGRFAAELALCLAQTGHSRVLLVEADFGEPTLHRLLDVTLTGEEAMVRQLTTRNTRPGPWSLLRLKPSLSALLQDKTEPPELILGEMFRDGMIALSDVHDFVVILGPPDESGLPARAFSAWVDGVVVVAPDQAAPEVVRAMASFGPRKFQQVFVPKPPVR
jgi:Mrp family chromosome partitioning ATPase